MSTHTVKDESDQFVGSKIGQARAKNNKKEVKFIEDKKKRANLKSKRKRNIFKKAIELEKMFDQDICIVIRDKETDKVY